MIEALICMCIGKTPIGRHQWSGWCSKVFCFLTSDRGEMDSSEFQLKFISTHLSYYAYICPSSSTPYCTVLNDRLNRPFGTLVDCETGW